jgi:hypothetical protein
MADRSLACTEWQGHLAGWLMAQLDPEAEAALLGHLAGCPTCQAEADSLLAVAAMSLGADPGGEPWQARRDASPPPDLADRIVARVATERRGRWARRAGLVLAGVVAVGAVALAVGRDDAPSDDGEVVAFARRAPGVDATASVAPDAAGSTIELTAEGLDPDVTYALWLTPPGGGYRERVAAGTFRPDGDGTVAVELRSALPADQMGRVWATTPDGQVALDTEP